MGFIYCLPFSIFTIFNRVLDNIYIFLFMYNTLVKSVEIYMIRSVYILDST